jgi:WD40 repeat protein
MTIRNSNLLPIEKDNVALDISSNDQAKKTFELRHMIKLNSRCRGVRSVNVTSDNRFLIITYESRNPGIRVADLEKLEFLPHKYTGHTDSVRLTSITRDNKAFHTASWDGSSRRFEIESGKCTQVFSGFGRSPSCFLDPEQKFLFTASYDSDIDIETKNVGRCWDLSSGNPIKVYKHTYERNSPGAIDIAYDEGRVYTGSDDGYAYQWDVNEEKPLMKYFSFIGTIRKVAVSANYFAAACTDGLVRVHNKFSGERFRYFLHGDTDVREVRISKDETKLWSASENGSISCFNLMKGEMIYHRKIHSLWIWSLCLMNDEKILVTGSGDGSVAFLSADSGQILAQLLNLPWDNDFLITCPPDKIFPNGFFYTTNKDFIQVVIGDKEKRIRKKLDLSDPRREAYINKLNLKNLIITRLKNNGHYTSLTDHYMRNQIILNQVGYSKVPQLLKA